VSLTVEESNHYLLTDETSWSYWTTVAPLGYGLNTVEDRIFSVAMFHEVRNPTSMALPAKELKNPERCTVSLCLR
jgi:hypothetical protein